MRAMVAVSVLALAAGCQSIPADAPKASASLQPTKGSSVRGTVAFVQIGDKVRVTANVGGLKPSGQFGFHIHEAGDCGSGDGMSAGGHFNPLGKPHAPPSTVDRHAGDMPMLEAGASGDASLTAELDVITIGGGAADVVGKGVIVHKDADDFKTQPTGNSGARVACGVIRRS